MNITLTSELEEFVETEIKRGKYPTASEVICAGLRRLQKDRERNRSLRSILAELEARLIQSIDCFDRGEVVEGEAAFDRLYARIKERGSCG